MEKSLAAIFAALGWFAVLMQYYLIVENRVTPVGETTIRFFSFFTILTNALAAIYLTRKAAKRSAVGEHFFDKPGVLTAITVYITIVGLVYQTVLRHVWEPTGLQMVVDELLHSIMPVCVILFWFLYEKKSAVTWSQLLSWMIYPLVYLIFILIRGALSGFYPYPFIDVSKLGLQIVLANGFFLLIVFLIFCALYIAVAKIIEKKKRKSVIG
jgi:hypothetical protein